MGKKNMWVEDMINLLPKPVKKSQNVVKARATGNTARDIGALLRGVRIVPP
jgi:hypothetical protein